MGVRSGIDRKKVGCRSLIDANLEGQVGVNKFKLYLSNKCSVLFCIKNAICSSKVSCSKCNNPLGVK